MKNNFKLLWLPPAMMLLVALLALTGCGGSSPAAPSGGGATAAVTLSGTGTSIAGTGFNAVYTASQAGNPVPGTQKSGTGYFFSSCPRDAAGNSATFPCATLYFVYNSATAQVEDVVYIYEPSKNSQTAWGIGGTTAVPGLTLGAQSVTFNNVTLQGYKSTTTSLTLNGTLNLASGGTGSVPAAPTNVRAYHQGVPGEIKIDFDAVTGATSYNLYYATAPGVTKASPKLTSAAPNPSPAQLRWTITNLTSGVTYYFRLTAVNSNGESALSSPEQVVTAP